MSLCDGILDIINHLIRRSDELNSRFKVGSRKLF
jgi:hypothetical protein